jgi:threonylcarbamoyladenosine tRNA methylthiotransferase MtaB
MAVNKDPNFCLSPACERGRTVAVVTHGCRVNQEEIDCLLGELRDRGFRSVRPGKPADWVVINTCSVTAAGEADARKAIRRASRLSGGGRVVVTGCYAQRDPQEAVRLGADLVVGNAEKWRLADLLCSAAGEAEGSSGILCGDDPTTQRFLRHSRRSAGLRTRAALKIQDGCNEHCTYCIVPRLRGRSVSRDPEEVLAEARALVGAGYREITLTGIHTASYRAKSAGGSLAALLRLLLDIEDLRRIRINSLEPNWVDRDLLETIAGSPRFCRHLHFPLQSGDRKILKRMGRAYSPARYREVVDMARSLIPGVAIGADVMVGFPGEDEEAFARTVSLIEQVRPAYLHVFPFSERPGVAASRLAGKCEGDTKRRRAKQMAGIDLRLRAGFLRASDGEVHDLLVESKRDAEGRPMSLTDTYVRVAVACDLPGGSWVRARLRWTGEPRRMLAEPVAEIHP